MKNSSFCFGQSPRNAEFHNDVERDRDLDVEDG